MNKQHQAPWGCIYRKEEKNNCKPGKRPRADQKYFEILCLCLLQAGLNWGSIRKHWQRYKEGFYGFDILRLSRAKAKELLEDPRVIRNSKKIEAIIREEKLDAVKAALESYGYLGMTVSEVSGRGQQGGLVLQWRVGEYKVEFLPKIKVEVVVLDDDVAKILNAITSVTRTGEIGDGKLFVIPVENAVRVRTGEEGDDAI